MSEHKVVNDLVQDVANLALVDAKPVSLREARRTFERRYILMVLELHQWRVGAAARALGLQRPNLYRKARQLNIPLRSADRSSTDAA
jgi:DNA-binding NtrC family response regulator